MSGAPPKGRGAAPVATETRSRFCPTEVRRTRYGEWPRTTALQPETGRAMLRPMVAIARTPARTLRAAVLPALLCSALAGAAAAHDYIVVASSEPAIARGLAVDGGQKLAVAPGHAITLMHASGALFMLRGAAGGVVAPKHKAVDVETARLEVFRTLVAAKPREVSEGLGARRTRGGVCPAADSLMSLDAIAQVQAAGCTAPAAQALEAWIAAHPPEEL